MGCGTLRPRGDLTTVSSAVSFTAFGFGLQYYGCEAERIMPLQLFFCLQEGEMPIEAVGARTERKSLQLVYDRDLLGSSASAPLDEDSRAIIERLREFLFFGVHQMTTVEAFMEFRSCLDTAMALGLLDSAQLDEL
ncbi:unnamed protein product [Prunus armeniaca]